MSEVEDISKMMHRLFQGERQVFADFVTLSSPFVFRLLSKHVPAGEVENVAQDVFVSLYQSLDKNPEIENPLAWLKALTLRRAYDFWRESYRRKRVEVQSGSEEVRRWSEECLNASSAAEFTTAENQREARAVLSWLFARLSAEDRMVLSLVYLDELPVKDAAKLLGWSVTNVKVRALRVRRKARQLLESCL